MLCLCMEADARRWPVLLMFVLLALLGIGPVGIKETEASTADQGIVNLEDHPIYGNYTFSEEETVIEIGYQPLWMPTSNITEFMKRDPILREELAALGYSLVFHPFLKGDDVNFFMLSGDLEVGMGGDMPALRMAASGDVVVVSIIQEGPVSIVSRDVREMSGLKGKRIAYAPGSSAHYYLLNTLRKNHVDLLRVKLIPMDVTLMPEALDAGRIDAFAAWEPTPSIALAKSPGLVLTHRGRSRGFLYVSGELMRRNSEVVYQLLASEIRALKWLRKGPANVDMTYEWVNDAVLQLSSEGLAISRAQMRRILSHDLVGLLTRHCAEIPRALLAGRGELKHEFELMKELGLISIKAQWMDVKKKFDPSAIETVVSHPTEYRLLEEIQFDDGDSSEWE